MPDVGFETEYGIAIITIRRPQVRNAVDRATAESLSEAFDELDSRSDISVGILTGEGGTFCAGMDLKALAATGERPMSKSRGSFGIVERPPEKPLVAAVEGSALGGGLEVALSCDLIVAADDARLGLPEVRRGLVAAAGGVFRLPDRIPRNVAKEMMLTGVPISAARAYELGLVNRVVANGESLTVALDICREIAAGAPLAIRASKRIADESADWPRDQQFSRQLPILQPVRESADAQEGARAFVEKRRPVWKGE